MSEFPSRLARLREALRARLRRSILLALAGLLVMAGVALAAIGLRNPSFESHLAGWKAQTIRGDAYSPRDAVYNGPRCSSRTQAGVCVINGSDRFTIREEVYNPDTGELEPLPGREITVTPNAGKKMVRLGGPFHSATERQDPNIQPVIAQTFTVDRENPVLRLDFNIFTWDYAGFDDLAFTVKLIDRDGQRISEFHQGAFGTPGDSSLKTTGWRPATLDLSDYAGQKVHLQITAGGTRDNVLGFWAYIDAALTKRGGGPPAAGSPGAGSTKPKAGRTNGRCVGLSGRELRSCRAREKT
jgi:hypothetical protein